MTSGPTLQSGPAAFAQSTPSITEQPKSAVLAARLQRHRHRPKSAMLAAQGCRVSGYEHNRFGRGCLALGNGYGARIGQGARKDTLNRAPAPLYQVVRCTVTFLGCTITPFEPSFSNSGVPYRFLSNSKVILGVRPKRQDVLFLNIILIFLRLCVCVLSI